MKVLLVANYPPDDQASMRAFHQVLERELPRTGCEVRVVAPRRIVLRVPASSRWWKWLGYIDKFVLFLPRLAAQARWADVVHICDHSNGMYVPRVKRKPTVITCHDVIAYQASLGLVPGWQVSASGRVFQRLIFRGLAQADLVACVSALTHRDLLGLRLADERKVVTVPNGLNADFAPVPPDEAWRRLAAAGLQGQPRYLLHVGLDLPRKNRMGVLQAFIALQRRAAAGGTQAVVDQLLFVGPELSDEMAALADQAGVAGRVRTLQGLSHDALQAAYSNATALLFPSLQEGFGWPVIEAQACGCPVFTSDLAPMNEIGGPGAAYVDPHDPLAMAAAIEAAFPRLDAMRRQGLDNAAHYGTQQMTSRYVAAYQRVIEQRAASPAVASP